MSNSRRFGILNRRVLQLRRHFLPKTFSPTGSYSPRQLDLTRAFRLLAHAEIESFIEDITQQTVLKKVGEWQRHRKPSDLLICFIACYHAGWVDEEDEDNSGITPPTPRIKVKDAAEEAVQEALNQYMQKIKKNNGIKAKDLKKLILPIGVRVSDLDATWMTNLDNFGKLRGDVAHKTVGVLQPIDPLSEFNTVNQLISGLKKLDEIIVKISR